MCTVLFLVTYSSGLDVIPWLVNAEIYPENLIGGASSFAASTNWLLNFIVLLSFNLKHLLGHLVAIVVFNLLGFVFVWYFLVETQGNTNRKNIALIMNIKQSEVNALLVRPSSSQLNAASTTLESFTDSQVSITSPVQLD